MKVYVILVNADLIEGRGPYKYKAVCDSAEAAIKYIGSQTGVQGRTTELERYQNSGIYASQNDHEIIETEVMSLNDVNEFVRKRNELENTIQDLEEKIRELQMLKRQRERC